MGTIDVAYNVDATALFYARPQPDMSKLITDLNGRLSQYPGCHMTMSPLSHDDWWLLSCSEFHLMIAFSDAPSKDSRLLASAKSAVCDLRRFDYGQVVDSHQAHLHIEVGDGNAPLPPEARTIMKEFGESAICDPKLKMMALHWAAQFIAHHAGFLAMHFGPSDRLFSPEEISECAAFDVPTPLLMHPVPSLPEPGPNGVDGYHIRLKNPQHLDGPSITLEGLPISIPLRTGVSLLNTLHTARAKGKVKLSHGSVIKPSAKLALYARKVDAHKDAPNGEIILSFWKGMGHDTARTLNAPMQTEPETVAAPARKAEVAQAATPIAKPAIKPARPTAPVMDAQRITDPEQVSADIHVQEKRSTTPAAIQDDPRDLTDALLKVADTKIIHQPDRVADRLEDLTNSEDDEMVEGQEPRRRGPHLWLINKFRRVPMDSRAKIAGIAAIIGLQVFWAPYSGFTGGMPTDATAAGTSSLFPIEAFQAFLTE